MTKFEVLLSKSASDFVLSLDEKTRNRIKSSLKELENGPFSSRAGCDLKKLHGFHNPDMYRIRIGDFRALYSVEKNQVKVTLIFRRGKGYEWLE